MTLGKALAAAVAAALLAGCTTGMNIDKMKSAQPQGSAFKQALVSEYQDIVRYEADKMYDWRDADYFATKGLKVQRGDTVMPEELDNWNLPAEKTGELADARNRLVAALDDGARTAAPDLAARAQGRFDCWIEQQEENHQPDHIAGCREDFYAAMNDLEAAMAPEADKTESEPEPAPEPAPEPEPEMAAPESVTLYFAFDSPTMMPEGIEKVDGVAGTIEANPDLAVSITGHADRAGPRDYNQQLSLKRAQNVREALITQGVPEDKISISARGEGEPAVTTADGTREAQNRRVEVVLQ